VNLYTFFNTVATAVQTDDTLGTWCAVNIGRVPDVRLEVPAGDLPDLEADGPYIQLGSPAKTMSQESPRIEYYVEIELGFSCGAYKGRTDDASEPAGVELMCELCERVLAVIKANLPSTNFSISEAQIFTDTLGHADDVYGLMAVSFVEIVTIGTDPLV